MRLEFNAPNSSMYNLIPMGKDGLVVFFQAGERSGKDSTIWDFDSYNIRFERKWEKRVTIDNDMSAVDYVQNNDKLIVCFLTNQRKNNVFVKLLSLDVPTGLYQTFAFDIPDKISIAGTYCLNDNLLLLANGRNACYILVYDFKTQKLISTQTITNLPNAEIMSAFADTLTDKLHIITTTDRQKTERNLLYHVFDSKNLSLQGMMLEPASANQKLITANCISTPNGLFIAGSYNKKDERSQQSTYTNYSESAGLFITKIENGKQSFTKSYNFRKFIRQTSNNSGGQKIVSEKVDEESMNSLLIPHELMFKDGEIQLMVETFKPEFRMVAETGYYNNYYNGMSPYTRTIFEGFRFGNALTAGFDKEGNMLWTNVLGIWDVLTPYMSSRMHGIQDQEEQVWAYNNNGEVNYAVIQKDSTLTNTQMLRVEKKYPADRVLGSINGNMRFWYDNYYIAFGYQTIRNNRLKNSRRDVFYINKIAYQ